MTLKDFGLFFAKAREESGFESQRQLAIASGVSNGTIARIEGGTQKPTPETLKKLAPFLKTVSYEVLLEKAGYIGEKERNDLPELTEKDERDIMKDLEKIINNLENKDGLASFDGRTLDDMDEEDRQLLINSLENSMRLAKRLAKQKFTPKKYRD